MPQTKFLLDEKDIPTHWYNVVADMPNPPLPPLGPDGNPVSPERMLAIFPGNILEQEMSAERWIPIPEPVREAYRIWRPSPLFRAHRLEALYRGGAQRLDFGNDLLDPTEARRPRDLLATHRLFQFGGIVGRIVRQIEPVARVWF